MKKYLSLFLVFLMTLFCFSGCGSQQNTSETASSAAETAASMVTKSDLTNTAKLKIVTTIFPEYDWVKSILGDQTENVELTMLLDNGVDLHSYQPTADDIAKISDCDLFIYVGGESDGWVDDALKNASNKSLIFWMSLVTASRKKKLLKAWKLKLKRKKQTEKKNRNMMNMYGFLSKIQKHCALPLHLIWKQLILTMQTFTKQTSQTISMH
jgi:ABC-type Zn uptake system ZnuABC Zn-binding protein ZnuA